MRGYENHKTPISDYLVAKFSEESSDISINVAEAEDLFDRLELIVALSFAHHRVEQVESSGTWFSMPPGRFMWKRSGTTLEDELKRIEDLADSDAFFQAGMMGGSRANAAATFQAIREFRKEVRGHFR